jgi:hypothetical protein
MPQLHAMDQHSRVEPIRNFRSRTGFRSDMTKISRSGWFFLPLLAVAPACAQPAHEFASVAACRGSGVFSAGDCAAAFDQAAELMRARAPHFSNRIDCVLSYKLCERQEGGYQPSMLGVELRKTRGGTAARPVLAVEAPPDLFQTPAIPNPSNPLPQTAAGLRSRPAPSVYGDLLVDASLLAPTGPQTLAKYRRLIAASHLRKSEAKADGADAAAPAAPVAGAP